MYVSTSVVVLKGYTFISTAGTVGTSPLRSICNLDAIEGFLLHCFFSSCRLYETTHSPTEIWRIGLGLLFFLSFFTFFTSTLSFLAVTEAQHMVLEEISNSPTNSVRTSSWCSTLVFNISALASIYNSPRVSLIIMYGSLKMTTEFTEPAFLWLIAMLS